LFCHPQLGRQENFSLFIPKHRKIAGRLIDIFMGVRTIDDLQSVAAYSRDRVNPQLFNYALSVALLHRPDTKNLDIPLFAGLFPDKFVDSRVFERAREEATIVPAGSRRPVTRKSITIVFMAHKFSDFSYRLSSREITQLLI
jgi:tyrosinase